LCWGFSQLSLPIAKWGFWCSESFLKTYTLPGHQFTDLDVSFLPLMQRRRLNSLSKIFFHTVNICEPNLKDQPIVFGSRYGELPRTVNILKSLGIEELVSPTDFSHSVHNTPVALYSIYTKNHQPANAISAGEDTLMATILESVSLFHIEKKDVLLVFGEDKLPEPYTQPNLEDAIHAYGLAILVSSTNPKITLTWQKNAPMKTPRLQIPTFMEGLFKPSEEFNLNAFGHEYLFKKEVHAK
jgi:hypothetical protein